MSYLICCSISKHYADHFLFDAFRELDHIPVIYSNIPGPKLFIEPTDSFPCTSDERSERSYVLGRNHLYFSVYEAVDVHVYL